MSIYLLPQDAIFLVMPAVGQDPPPVLPAPPTALCCPRVFVLPNVPLVTMTMVTGSVRVSCCSNSVVSPKAPKAAYYFNQK